jgi:hypothetical protein
MERKSRAISPFADRHGFVESVKADNVLPVGTTSKTAAPRPRRNDVAVSRRDGATGIRRPELRSCCRVVRHETERDDR